MAANGAARRSAMKGHPQWKALSDGGQMKLGCQAELKLQYIV